MRRVLILAAAALLATGCAAPTPPETTMSDPAGPAASPSPSAGASSTPDAVAGFTLTSPDFADGGELADWATAQAFGGQCAGDNLNPALDWRGVPDGTEAFVITMIDRSAGDFVHWVHGDLPADVTSVARGASAELPGFVGRNQGSSPGYFGPCPPGPKHRYEFTVYALDAPLGFEDGTGLVDVLLAMDGHVLAESTITGMRSGPA